MRLILGTSCLSLLVYVAGRPMQRDWEAHRAHERYADEAGSSLGVAHQMSYSTTLPGLTSPVYERVPVPGGGEVRLTPKLVNAIFEEMKKLNSMTTAQATHHYRSRKDRLGISRTQSLSHERKLGRIPPEDSKLPRAKQRRLRLLYMGVKPKGKAPLEYRRIPYGVLKQAYYTWLANQTLDRHMEIKKAYAKHLIEEMRIVVDPETETVLPVILSQHAPVGRRRQEVVTQGTVWNRRYKAKKKAEAMSKALAAGREQQDSLKAVEADDWAHSGTSEEEETEAPPLQWSQVSPQSSRYPDGRSGCSYEHMPQVLAWPPGARRQRTFREEVPDDDVPPSEAHQEETASESDTQYTWSGSEE